MSTIAILGGTGNEGPGLGLRWARAGYQVIIGSRRLEKANQTANELNQVLDTCLVRGALNPEAARQADVAVLTVPYTAHRPLLERLRQPLQGKILIDVTVPLKPPDVGRVHLPPGGSAAAQAQAILGAGVKVVAALQNVSFTHLRDLEHDIDCDVLVCGDDAEAKQTVMELIKVAGMRALDAGPLDNAVVVEGLTAVLIHLNRQFKIRGAGIRITGLPPRT
jgi:NADPH-dependent F420 reductase